MSNKFLITNDYANTSLSNITSTANQIINNIINDSFLDVDKKIKHELLPKITLSSIYVVDTISDRDALIVSVPLVSGDSVKVLDFEIPRIFIFDGVIFQEIFPEIDINSLINVDTSAVANNDFLYFHTPSLNWKNKQIQINDISPFAAENIVDKQLLIYDSSQQKIINSFISTNNLSDITYNLPVNQGDILKYDSFIQTWSNYTPYINVFNSGVNGQVLRIESNNPQWKTITDIDNILPVNIVSQSQNQLIKYNSFSSKWENFTQSVSGTGLGIILKTDMNMKSIKAGSHITITNNTDDITIDSNISSLDSLTDVVLTSATNNQILRFNGINWINSDETSGGGGGLPTPIGASGQIIKSNGTAAVWSTNFPPSVIYDSALSSIVLSVSSTPTYGSQCFFLETGVISPNRTCQNVVNIGASNRLPTTGGNNNIQIGLNLNNTNNQGTNNIMLGASCLFNAGASVTNTISMGNFCNRNLLTSSSYVYSLGDFCNFSNITLNNSLNFNASGSATAGVSGGIVIRPMRSTAAGTSLCYYNTTTFELSYNTTVSSRKIKKDIDYIKFDDSIYDNIAELKPVSYHLINENENDPISYGFIAEEIADNSYFNKFNFTVPDIKIGDTDYYDVLAIDYCKMNMMLWSIVKKLSSDVVILKKKKQELEASINSILERVEMLEMMKNIDIFE